MSRRMGRGSMEGTVTKAVYRCRGDVSVLHSDTGPGIEVCWTDAGMNKKDAGEERTRRTISHALELQCQSDLLREWRRCALRSEISKVPSLEHLVTEFPISNMTENSPAKEGGNKDVQS